MSTAVETKAARWAELVDEYTDRELAEATARFKANLGPKPRRIGVSQDYEGVWRDQWRRPLLPDDDYTRVDLYDSPSNAGKLIEDGGGLKIHEGRVGAMAVAHNEDVRDLILSTLPERLDLFSKADKTRLDAILKDAKGSVGAFGAANRGTTIHAYLEKIMLGEALRKVPDRYVALLAAFRKAVEERYERVDTERFVACRELGFAGTLDLRFREKGSTGSPKIADYKSGASVVEYPKGMALQLAIYAHSKPVDKVTGEVTEWDVPTDPDEGLLVHVPANGSSVQVYPVDLRTAWELAGPAARLARDWQRLRPEQILGAPVEVETGSTITEPGFSTVEAVDAAIAAAEDRAQLVEVWKAARKAGTWVAPRHADLSQARTSSFAPSAA